MITKKETLEINKVRAFTEMSGNLILIKYVGLKDAKTKKTILLYPSHFQDTMIADFYPSELIWLQQECEKGKTIKIELPVTTRRGIKTIYEADICIELRRIIQEQPQ